MKYLLYYPMTHLSEKEKKQYREISDMSRDKSLDSNLRMAFRTFADRMVNFIEKSEESWKCLLTYLKTRKILSRENPI